MERGGGGDHGCLDSVDPVCSALQNVASHTHTHTHFDNASWAHSLYIKGPTRGDLLLFSAGCKKRKLDVYFPLVLFDSGFVGCVCVCVGVEGGG